MVCMMQTATQYLRGYAEMSNDARALETCRECEGPAATPLARQSATCPTCGTACWARKGRYGVITHGGCAHVCSFVEIAGVLQLEFRTQ